MTTVRAFSATAAAVAVAALATACGGHATSTRAPTQVERAAIQQAIFDFAAANPVRINPSIIRVRLSPVPAASQGNYAAFARADLNVPNSGFAAMLLAYRKTALAGWRVLDTGSAEVGCALGSAVYGTRKQVVLRALGLGCP